MFFSGSAVWGHRGWPARYPDNVEAGIRAAAEVAAGVEVDVRRCRDGLLALSHDADLGGRLVAEHRWADLAPIDLGGHRPALLDDILDLPVMLDLEVKNEPWEPGHESDHGIARDVAERARPGDLVTSFWWPSVDAVRLSHPQVTTGLLVASPVDPIAALQHAIDGGHGWLAPEWSIIDEALVEACRREGIGVVAWTVDDAAVAAGLAGLGVAAIITNRPGELIAEDPTSEDTR